MSARVLIIGGTGLLGLPVARQLNSDGFDVTIMSTDPVAARERLGPGFPLVYGDVTIPESLKGPIAEAEMVHLNLNSSLDPELYQKIEIEGTANVAAAAQEAGIKRLSMITGASSTGELSGEIYLDAKVKAERAVIDSGVPYTIMRPSWFFESLPHFVQDDRAAVIGEQPIPRAWLASEDYARQVSRALQTEEAANVAFYNLGPIRMTMFEALTIYCQVRHPELKPETISISKARMMAALPGQRQLRRAVGFFKYIEKMPEPEPDALADRVLGPNLTTLSEWLDRNP